MRELGTPSLYGDSDTDDERGASGDDSLPEKGATEAHKHGSVIDLP